MSLLTYWITVARGFVGRHLVKKLSDSGHRVIGIGHGIWSLVRPLLTRVDHRPGRLYSFVANRPD